MRLQPWRWTEPALTTFLLDDRQIGSTTLSSTPISSTTLETVVVTFTTEEEYTTYNNDASFTRVVTATETSRSTSIMTAIVASYSDLSQSTTTTTLSADSQSSLAPRGTSSAAGGTSAKAVGIAVGVIVPAVLLLFAFAIIDLVRCRRNSQQIVTGHPPEIRFENPELEGSPYDPTIAGPVRRKAELSTSRSHRCAEQTIRHFSVMGYTELSAGTEHQHDGNSCGSQDENTPIIRPREPKAQATEKQNQAVRFESKSSTTLGAAEWQSNDDDLVAEADLLVQELGVITLRKKQLEKSATASNTKPEEVEGSKGEDYRDLLGREERLRKRLEAIQQERCGTTLHENCNLMAGNES